MAEGWLIRNDSDRERMLDMDRRIAPLRTVSFAILGLTLIGMAPWEGWWPLIALFAAGALFGGARRIAVRVTRPEYLLFAVWVASELIIALCVVLTGGAESATLGWLALPVVTLGARFSLRGVVVGVAFAVLLLLTVAFASSASAVLEDPSRLMAVTALLPAAAVLSLALARSDIEHREESVLDPLTQLLNRKALERRAAELAQQSDLDAEPIGVVIGDIDHFKAVNDTFGHATGDAVLRALSYLLRKQLRAFDLLYRMGGEEFLVLLPGADADRASDVAETLRAAVAAETLAGQAITMSFGVAAASAGERFDLYDVAGAADRALYAAKAAGRNRVRTEDPRLPLGAGNWAAVG